MESLVEPNIQTLWPNICMSVKIYISKGFCIETFLSPILHRHVITFPKPENLTKMYIGCWRGPCTLIVDTSHREQLIIVALSELFWVWWITTQKVLRRAICSSYNAGYMHKKKGDNPLKIIKGYRLKTWRDVTQYIHSSFQKWMKSGHITLYTSWFF